MGGFVDPRATPDPSAGKPRARTTADPDVLEELHELCRHGRLYDVERWIADDRPLQSKEAPARSRRRGTTALEIALKQQNHALVLLLLCNGYDPNPEPHCALDLALDARRPDLVELLLSWGADPHRVDLEKLFGTYDSALFERFYRLGVDLTRRHALAEALGYHTSNRPLYGFAKRYHQTDARIQRDLDMALAHHAWEGNERGAFLCLWAGGDPHASVPSLRYYDEEDEDEEEAEAGDGSSAVYGACYSGQVKLLERFAPDPSRHDFDRFYRVAHSAAVVEVLARSALPTDMTEVVQSLVQSVGWYFGSRDAVAALRRLFELGARWTEASPKDVGELRRWLYRLDEWRFKEVVLILGTDDYCSAEIRRELARTEGFQKRMRAADLLPERGDRWWQRRRGAEQARAMMAAYGLDVPAPAKQRPRR